METLVKNLIDNQQQEKIQKPDCSTRTGRSLLAFYLKTKFKQILNYDKKSHNPLIKSVKNDFFDNFAQRLISNPQDRILIALTGESASGKSTICKQISASIEKFNLPVTVLSADNYFNDISDLIKKYGNFDALRDSGYDIDSPDNFYLSQLREDLSNLQKGNDIYSPEYLVNGTGISRPKSKFVKSNKIVIIEGMCSIYDEVSDMFDIKVYIEIDDEERKKRFINRAIERNQDQSNALKHWEYILQAGKKYVYTHKKDCDLVLNGNCDLKYLEYILEYIHLITSNFIEI